MWIYSNQDDNVKRYKARRYYLLKGIIKNHNVIVSRENFCDQPIDPDTKQNEEIRKLTRWLSEDYATGCLLDYEYMKNHCRLITVDLSRQEKLDADTKAIEQIEFVGQLKN